MAAAENILLIRLKSIGDIVLTLPAVNLVRQAFPQGRISYLVSAEHAPLLEGFRAINSVIPVDRGRLRQRNPAVSLTELFRLLDLLRRSKFSLVVDLQGYGETALLTWWTAAPQRWGTVYRGGRKWAYTRGVQRDARSHPAEDYLFMLRACRLPPGPVVNDFVLPDRALDEARELFQRREIDPRKPTLLIHPFTSAPQKDWPLERYLAVGQFWNRRGVQVLFSGGRREEGALEPVRQAGFPVSTEAPLLVTAGLARLSTLVLGADTGVLHLAVAMGRRVVMIIGSTDPGRSYPFQHRDWAVTPVKDQAVSDISADAVNAACDRAFAQLGGARRESAS